MKIKTKEIDRAALQALCMNYDFSEGEYPESKYEGYSLYQFYLNSIGVCITLTWREWMKVAMERIRTQRKEEIEAEEK